VHCTWPNLAFNAGAKGRWLTLALGGILQRRCQLRPQLLFQLRCDLLAQCLAVFQHISHHRIDRVFPVRFHLILDVCIRPVVVRLVGYSGSHLALNCATQFFIGRVRHARDFISDEMIGGDIRERISEILGDEVGEVAECFSMTSDQERELGKVVLDWIEAGPGFNCWGIKDVEPIDAAIAASGRQE